MPNYKLEPTGQYILVKKLKPEDSLTKGGIIVPGGDKRGRDGAEGIVLAVGKGRAYAEGGWIEFQVDEGDRVIYDYRVGTQVTLNNIDCVIITENEILGVLTEVEDE